ncbi:c-type cytochrome [Altericroceibacterium xinjiangense]|uniref:c-type cytochrome n=1 Tax=Altericroceibacterium xinjiangense TaxID=762261 RepID=UPI000F7E4A3F|nr:cytochrome c [Altericroceibacterium xinjiangense]
MTRHAFPRSRLSLAGAILALAAFLPFGVQLHANASTNSSAEATERGRALFTDTGCVQCHTLRDAGSTGGAGPVLDGNPHLTRALIVERVAHGRNDMPGFLGILAEEEIEQLADYLLHVTAAGDT